MRLGKQDYDDRRQAFQRCFRASACLGARRELPPRESSVFVDGMFVDGTVTSTTTSTSSSSSSDEIRLIISMSAVCSYACKSMP